MRPRIYLNFILIFGLGFAMSADAHSQVAPTAEGGPTTDDDAPMMTPPPVGGMPFVSGANADTRSNYMDTSLTLTPSYIDNVLPGESSTSAPSNETAKPVSDVAFSIAPELFISPIHAQAIRASAVFSEPSRSTNIRMRLIRLTKPQTFSFCTASPPMCPLRCRIVS